MQPLLLVRRTSYATKMAIKMVLEARGVVLPILDQTAHYCTMSGGLAMPCYRDKKKDAFALIIRCCYSLKPCQALSTTKKKPVPYTKRFLLNAR